VTVEDNFPMTNAGLHNIKNISEEFGCEIISLKPNIKAQKHLMRKTFELFGKPTWYIDRLIYTYPLYMAKKLNIPLLVYGENVNYEYSGGEETYSAKEQIENGVASEIPKSVLVDNVVSERDLYLCEAPDISGLDPVYLSYFVPWNSYNNYTFAKTRGFWDLKGEWHRTHHIEDFDQIDSRAYLVHPWMKYPKFGHATATDYASRFIRYGMMDREEALKLVAKHDHNLDKQEIVDLQVLKDNLILEVLVPRELKEDLRELKEHRVLKELKEPRVLKEDLQEPKELRVLKVLKEPQVR
jgi:hypothetical protein